MEYEGECLGVAGIVGMGAAPKRTRTRVEGCTRGDWVWRDGGGLFTESF